jgi:hypothetical protein
MTRDDSASGAQHNGDRERGRREPLRALLAVREQTSGQDPMAAKIRSLSAGFRVARVDDTRKAHGAICVGRLTASCLDGLLQLLVTV